MKNPYLRKLRRKPKGFALIVTLSLMILLTVIAVGLLTLSTISLRASGAGAAMSSARANAKLAMMIAIGELQRTTGPDRAITAPASIVKDTNPMGVTGVWTPWKLGATGDSRTHSAREGNFKQWLLSSVDPTSSQAVGTLPLAAVGAKDSVTLVGDGYLGTRSADRGDDQRINVISTRINNGKSNGGMAWAVIDESTKARVDLYEEEPGAKAAALLRAGAPPTDGIAALKGLGSLQPTVKDAGTMVSLNTAGFLLKNDREKITPYGPDLTVHAKSLLTDVVAGGFKKDLSLWFAKGLSGTEKRDPLYQSTGTLAINAPADPPLGLLEAYHDTYKSIGQRVGSVNPVAGGIAAKPPRRYSATRGQFPNPNAPTEPLLFPSIVRVDIIFSLIARPAHGGRRQTLINAQRPYMLHLLYLPVVTIHNPYDAPMSVEQMKVTFKNVPIAFQFMLDRQPLTTGLVPLNQLFTGSQNNPNNSKDFGCTLGSAVSPSGGSSPFVLLPGQTKLFGTPKVSPNWTWQDEQPGAGSDGVALFDHRNDKTSNFQLTPKLVAPPTTGMGFDVDWLMPSTMKTAMGNTAGLGEGIVSLKGNESVAVNYGPFAPPAANGSFDIRVELKSGTASEVAAFSIKYGTADRLKAIVQEGTSVRYPTRRVFPETFPSRMDPPVNVGNLIEQNNTKISDYVNAKPFAIFSVGTKTTKESFVPIRTMADGNPVMNVADIDFTAGKDPVGSVPLEMVMMPIRNGNAAIEDLRETEEGFAFGGSGSLNGTSRAVFYELPRAPLQSIAQFRHANLSGSGFMPMSTYTVGESRAHPQIGTNTVTGTWTNGSVMLDHTWLSNEAMWDHFFLSTIADQTALQFDRAKDYNQVMTDFFGHTSRLPNQRFIPENPNPAAVPAAVSGATAPQDVIASTMFLNGGFNVNSTSKDAWIAVLSALRGAEIETLNGLKKVADRTTPFLRVRRPVGDAIDDQVVSTRLNRWEGYRSLTDSLIDELAQEIVVEVRKRGPFLSLSDFVNRGIGADTDDINVKGAIQAAIDRVADINNVARVDGVELGSSEVKSYGYKSDRAAIGNTAADSPGFLNQGDVLTILGSHITVRADTFTIRSYGEARDQTGKNITARAWCEAVVQRVPQFVDPNEAPTTVQAVLAPGDSGSANEMFGRQYQVVSFRWLSPEDV